MLCLLFTYSSRWRLFINQSLFGQSRSALEHMLKYCTGLQLVCFGQAFPESSNHFAHERYSLPSSFPQEWLVQA